MPIYENIDSLIGKTPIIKISKYCQKKNLAENIYAKIEYFNPTGSVKDRIAKAMIDDAEKKGLLRPNSVIIEPTSGNTGIGLAAIAACRGYRIILTMPESMSIERRQLLKAYGAEIVLTNAKLGMKGAIAKAEDLAIELTNSFIPSQFANPSNADCHYQTTGQEIWNDMNGDIDVFIAGVGTGGTITGVGKYLKSQNKQVKIIGIEPAGSPILTKNISGSHGLQGIGAGFVPEVLDLSICDEIITITEEEAYNASRMLAKTEGLLVGISSGAALAAIDKLSDSLKDKKIVVLLPDTGMRYLSTPLFQNDN